MTFIEELTEVLEEQFPKGKCKERGHALVLLAEAEMLFEKYSNSTLCEQQRILKRIEGKIEFVKQCCKGKEADYRYYELANLRDSILDDIKSANEAKGSTECECKRLSFVEGKKMCKCNKCGKLWNLKNGKWYIVEANSEEVRK